MTREFRKIVIVAALSATTAFGLAAASDASSGRRIVIDIREFAFNPEMPTVRPGDTVVWKNSDIVPHTVTSNDESWDSDLIEPGEEWETVIAEDMLQDYFCAYHPSMIAALDIKPE